MQFSFIVTIDTDTAEHAEEVLTERCGPDEDYGFDYTIDYGPAPSGKKLDAATLVASHCSRALTENARHFSCSETDMLANFLHEWGEPKAAMAFLDEHSRGDEPGDHHYEGA